MVEVAAAQSDFTADRIREGNLEGVIWPYLGKFHIQPKKIQNATQNYNYVKKKATQFPKQ